jgi:hypothetical protein
LRTDLALSDQGSLLRLSDGPWLVKRRTKNGNAELNAKALLHLVLIFQNMGSNPQDPDYVDAGGGDVWEFVKGVSS